jgi:hypothetical protein
MSIISKIEGFFINSNASLPTKNKVVGYLGKDVPEEYIVTILSARSAPGGDGPITVRAILQDEVQMRTSSKWESFIDVVRSSTLGNVLELGAQALTNRSLQNAVTSRRIWRGTDPLSLTLNLRFEEEYNSKTEVMEACEALQCMCAPGEDKQTLGLLIPPGPSPFKNDVLDSSKELIAVYVGRVLAFTNVIIKDIQVGYQVRMGTDGLFKAAKVSVVFETYEIVTKNRLRSPNPSDGGIYSALSLENSQRYDASYETLNKASGFDPKTREDSLKDIGLDPNSFSGGG